MKPEEYAQLAADLYTAFRTVTVSPIGRFGSDDAFELTKVVLREVAAKRGVDAMVIAKLSMP